MISLLTMQDPRKSVIGLNQSRGRKQQECTTSTLQHVTLEFPLITYLPVWKFSLMLAALSNTERHAALIDSVFWNTPSCHMTIVVTRRFPDLNSFEIFLLVFSVLDGRECLRMLLSERFSYVESKGGQDNSFSLIATGMLGELFTWQRKFSQFSSQGSKQNRNPVTLLVRDTDKIIREGFHLHFAFCIKL